MREGKETESKGRTGKGERRESKKRAGRRVKGE
jgi:hypothetical protein